MATQPSARLSDFMVHAPAHELLGGERIDRILDAVRQHLGMEIAFVTRFVGEERELLNVRSDLDLPMGPGYREPKEDGYCWHIAQGRLPELIQDPKDHPFTQQFAITHMLPVGAHLNVPLRLSDGSLYGSFCALSRTPDRSMTTRDLGVLRAFAELAVEQIEDGLETEVRRESLESAIGRIIGAEQLTILHQPIHRLADGRPVGVECLARFPDSATRGPDKWFDEAVEIGRGVELEMLAVRRALETLAHVPAGFYASINVSPETVLSGDLLGALGENTRDNLVIEVTEHNRVDDYAELKAALEPLRARARIAIDDVGAGYAGLRHLVDLEPDILKLDMSLTRALHRDPARRALAGALVTFAEAIGASLVAEGVETAEERDALAEMGVGLAQGWYYSRAMPVVAAQQLLLGAARADEARGAAAPPRRSRKRA